MSVRTLRLIVSNAHVPGTSLVIEGKDDKCKPLASITTSRRFILNEKQVVQYLYASMIEKRPNSRKPLLVSIVVNHDLTYRSIGFLKNTKHHVFLVLQ